MSTADRPPQRPFAPSALSALPAPIARRALAGAGIVGALLVACWYAAFHIPAAERLDASIYTGFGGLRWHPHVSGVANFVAGLCNANHYVWLAVIPIVIAIVRRRALVAGGVVFILIAANLTTHLLKPLLAAPRPYGVASWAVSEASWPSGHATAAMALALCIVLASPARLRPYAAAAGGAFAVAVSYAFLTLGWHYPSDALAGFLVAAFWTLIVIAAIATLDVRLEHGRELRSVQLVGSQALTPAAVLLCIVLVPLAMLVAIRPESMLDYIRLHRAFVVGAAALGTLGVSLAAGVAMTLRR